jgi:hypothetical protein
MRRRTAHRMYAEPRTNVLPAQKHHDVLHRNRRTCHRRKFDGERARKLVRENSCDREGDCKGGRIVGGELPEAAERTRELIESKSEIEKGDSVPSVGVREVEES